MGILLLAIPIYGSAAPLTERQSLEFGLNLMDFQQLLASQVETARGELTRTETWINPEFELSREEVGDETETGVWLRQRLDLSGRRALQRDAAQANLSAMEAGAKSSRIERAANIRQQFFQTLYHQQQQDLLGHWVEKFKAVEAAMFKREASGDVSGYDRRRISREKVAILAQQRESNANYQAAWVQLLGILELDETQGFEAVQGELIPGVPPPLAEVLEALKDLPALAQLRHRSETKRLASRAFDLGHIPDLTIGLGQKRLEGPEGSDSGLMLSAALSLPLFDRQQGDYQHATAEHRQVESEYRLTLSRMQAEAHSLWKLTAQLADNARLFRQQSLAASYELLDIAETAYHNNELGVLELIDAYRNALESEVSALQLSLEARMKQIELDKLIGRNLP
ncbi:MAG: TolC family protein [Pseudomonadota bacterium]